MFGRCYTDDDLQGVAFEKRLDAEALYRKGLRVTAADTYKPKQANRLFFQISSLEPIFIR